LIVKLKKGEVTGSLKGRKEFKNAKRSGLQFRMQWSFIKTARAQKYKPGHKKGKNPIASTAAEKAATEPKSRASADPAGAVPIRKFQFVLSGIKITVEPA
jgi:hypothetical protein